MVGSSSQQRQLITYHVEFTEEEHPQPAPYPEHSLAYRRPTGGGRQVARGTAGCRCRARGFHFPPARGLHSPSRGRKPLEELDLSAGCT